MDFPINHTQMLLRPSRVSRRKCNLETQSSGNTKISDNAPVPAKRARTQIVDGPSSERGHDLQQDCGESSLHACDHSRTEIKVEPMSSSKEANRQKDNTPNPKAKRKLSTSVVDSELNNVDVQKLRVTTEVRTNVRKRKARKRKRRRKAQNVHDQNAFSVNEPRTDSPKVVEENTQLNYAFLNYPSNTEANPLFPNINSNNLHDANLDVIDNFSIFNRDRPSTSTATTHIESGFYLENDGNMFQNNHIETPLYDPSVALHPNDNHFEGNYGSWNDQLNLCLPSTSHEDPSATASLPPPLYQTEVINLVSSDESGPEDHEDSSILNVCVIDRSQPSLKLSKSNWWKVQQNIMEAIAAEGVKRHSSDVYKFRTRFINGFNMLYCNSRESLYFIIDCATKMGELWEGAQIDIVCQKYLPIESQIEFVLSLPKLDDASILKLISIQNAGLNTDKWRLSSSVPLRSSIRYRFYIDEQSKEFISAKNNKINYGFYNISIKIIRENNSRY